MSALKKSGAGATITWEKKQAARTSRQQLTEIKQAAAAAHKAKLKARGFAFPAFDLLQLSLLWPPLFGSITHQSGSASSSHLWSSCYLCGCYSGYVGTGIAVASRVSDMQSTNRWL